MPVTVNDQPRASVSEIGLAESLENDESDKWVQLFEKQNENMKDLIDAMNFSVRSTNHVVLPEFDEITCDLHSWCATADLCFAGNPPCGRELIIALSKALKGTSSSWLSQIAYADMTWSEFKTMFKARFLSNETIAAILINLSEDKPDENESLVAYASRLVTSLTNRWQNYSIEEIAVSTVLAHVANFDSKLQRLAFTNEILTRQQLLQELQAYSHMKRRSDLRKESKKHLTLDRKLSKIVQSLRGNEFPKTDITVMTQTNDSFMNKNPFSTNSKAISKSLQVLAEPNNTDFSSSEEHNMKCLHCGKLGHKTADCPSKSTNKLKVLSKSGVFKGARNTTMSRSEDGATSRVAFLTSDSYDYDSSYSNHNFFRDFHVTEQKWLTDPCSIAFYPTGTFSREVEQMSAIVAAQSPIAISLQNCPTSNSTNPLHFKGYWNSDSHGVFLNNGHSAYFTFESEEQPRLSGGPLMSEYIFEHMHLHWSVDDFTGCEHMLDGQGYAAELHLVHYNSKYESMKAAAAQPNGLAIVAFLLEAIQHSNPWLDKLVEGLDSIQKRHQPYSVPPGCLAWMKLEELQKCSYVTYKCSHKTMSNIECVTWIIFEKPLLIGTEQLSVLRHLRGLDNLPLHRNVRLTQRQIPEHGLVYVKPIEAVL